MAGRYEFEVTVRLSERAVRTFPNPRAAKREAADAIEALHAMAAGGLADAFVCPSAQAGPEAPR